MASIIKKLVGEYGPYAYHVERTSERQVWTFLGKLGAVPLELGPTDMSREEALEHRVTAGPPVTIGELDDDMQSFVREFDDEDVETVINDMLLERDHDAPRNILYAVKDVTDDERLEAAIDDVTNHYVELNEKVTREQAEHIKNELGDIIDVTITEPNNEFQDPMISLDVDDVALTENQDINAELLTEATSTVAETGSGQERLFETWGEALGKERVAEFKHGLDDPDALGFSLPTDVPATGHKDGRTPVTEIPYIGDATADDMHPADTDGVLAVEDIRDMTSKQRAWIDMPVEYDDYSTPTAEGVAKTIPAVDKETTTESLGHLLDLKDRRSNDGVMEFVDTANVLGVTADSSMRDESPTAPVTNVESDGNGTVIVESEDGSESRYAEEYWTVINGLRDSGEVTVETGDDTPAFARLPDGGDVVLAPRRSTE